MLAGLFAPSTANLVQNPKNIVSDAISDGQYNEDLQTSGGIRERCDHSGRSAALERAYVHDVYENCEESSGSIRPKVAEFLTSLDPGSIVCDVGCGSGRYLSSINPYIYTLGVDRCSRLSTVAKSQGNEVIMADNLELPFRDESFDAVLSLAVVHHFATTERRIGALRELARILRIGGRVIITVWAFEQKRRRFESQDVLVPMPPLKIRPCNQTEEHLIEDDNDECLTPYAAYADETTISSQSINDGDTSSISSSIPGETCYSFVKRTIQKLTGVSKKHSWFSDSWTSRDTTKNDSSLDCEDAKDLPIELRRLEDFEDMLDPPLSAGLKSRSLGSILYSPPQNPHQIKRSQSSVPSLGAHIPENHLCKTTSRAGQYPLPNMSSTNSIDYRRPKLVKQKQSLSDEHFLISNESLQRRSCDGDNLVANGSGSNKAINQRNTLNNDCNNEKQRPTKNYKNTIFYNHMYSNDDDDGDGGGDDDINNSDVKAFLRKQSSLNEDLMTENILRDREKIRKRMHKQMSLNEAFLCNSVFGKRLQVIREGFATKLKTSTGSLERVTKNGFVKIMRNFKSNLESSTAGRPKDRLSNFNNNYKNVNNNKYNCNNYDINSDKYINHNGNTIYYNGDGNNLHIYKNNLNGICNGTYDFNINNEEESQRRHSRESGSDSSKESSLQSDTSVESEDSFASVIYIPRSDQHSTSTTSTSTHTTSSLNSINLDSNLNNINQNSIIMNNEYKKKILRTSSVPISSQVMSCSKTSTGLSPTSAAFTQSGTTHTLQKPALPQSAPASPMPPLSLFHSSCTSPPFAIQPNSSVNISSPSPFNYSNNHSFETDSTTLKSSPPPPPSPSKSSTHKQFDLTSSSLKKSTVPTPLSLPISPSSPPTSTIHLQQTPLQTKTIKIIQQQQLQNCRGKSEIEHFIYNDDDRKHQKSINNQQTHNNNNITINNENNKSTNNIKNNKIISHINDVNDIGDNMHGNNNNIVINNNNTHWDAPINTAELKNNPPKMHEKITKQTIKNLPQIPKFKSHYSLVRQNSVVPMVSRKAVPLEIFNPEFDDLDSDSNESSTSSSDDSMDSVIETSKAVSSISGISIKQSSLIATIPSITNVSPSPPIKPAVLSKSPSPRLQSHHAKQLQSQTLSQHSEHLEQQNYSSKSPTLSLSSLCLSPSTLSSSSSLTGLLNNTSNSTMTTSTYTNTTTTYTTSSNTLKSFIEAQKQFDKPVKKRHKSKKANTNLHIAIDKIKDKLNGDKMNRKHEHDFLNFAEKFGAQLLKMNNDDISPDSDDEADDDDEDDDDDDEDINVHENDIDDEDTEDDDDDDDDDDDEDDSEDEDNMFKKNPKRIENHPYSGYTNENIKSLLIDEDPCVKELNEDLSDLRSLRRQLCERRLMLANLSPKHSPHLSKKLHHTYHNCNESTESSQNHLHNHQHQNHNHYQHNINSTTIHEEEDENSTNDPTKSTEDNCSVITVDKSDNNKSNRNSDLKQQIERNNNNIHDPTVDNKASNNNKSHQQSQQSNETNEFEHTNSFESCTHSNSTASLDSPSLGGSSTHHQYYHVFRRGELDSLINHHVNSLHIVSSYYERASWCVVAEKVQVWTI